MKNIDFTQQVAGHSNSLISYALNFTKDMDDAQDLVQDTLLKAIVYKDKFVMGTNLKGWLYTIMKNTFINNYRKLVKVNALVTQSDEISSNNLLYSSTKNNSDNKFLKEDIDKALTKLDENYRKPFLMYFEGFKYHEIALEQAIPIGTVKTRIHMARKILKENLVDYNTFDKTAA